MLFLLIPLRGEFEGDLSDPDLVALDRPCLHQRLIHTESGETPGCHVGRFGQGQVGESNRSLGGETLDAPAPLFPSHGECRAQRAVEDISLTKRRDALRLVDQVGDGVQRLSNALPADRRDRRGTKRNREIGDVGEV